MHAECARLLFSNVEHGHSNAGSRAKIARGSSFFCFLAIYVTVSVAPNAINTLGATTLALSHASVLLLTNDPMWISDPPINKCAFVSESFGGDTF